MYVFAFPFAFYFFTYLDILNFIPDNNDFFIFFLLVLNKKSVTAKACITDTSQTKFALLCTCTYNDAPPGKRKKGIFNLLLCG